MSRTSDALWLAALRPPPGFTLPSTTLTRVDDEALRLRAPGEVKRPETLNSRTLAPAPGGLFCEEVFGAGPLERGPFADDERVTEVRATRFGRIELPAPVVHPLALAYAADEVAARAEISRGELDGLAAYAAPERWARLGDRLAATEPGSALLLRVVPVLPPYLRPIRRLDDGGWALAGLNELYRPVVMRASRLRRLLELGAPDVFVAQEHRFMFEAVHRLIENEARPEPTTDAEGRPFASLRTLALGNGLFEALTELARRRSLGQPPDAALPRSLYHPIAALYAMGLELG